MSFPSVRSQVEAWRLIMLRDLVTAGVDHQELSLCEAAFDRVLGEMDAINQVYGPLVKAVRFDGDAA